MSSSKVVEGGYSGSFGVGETRSRDWEIVNRYLKVLLLHFIYTKYRSLV